MCHVFVTRTLNPVLFQNRLESIGSRKRFKMQCGKPNQTFRLPVGRVKMLYVLYFLIFRAKRFSKILNVDFFQFYSHFCRHFCIRRVPNLGSGLILAPQNSSAKHTTQRQCPELVSEKVRLERKLDFRWTVGRCNWTIRPFGWICETYDGDHIWSRGVDSDSRV